MVFQFCSPRERSLHLVQIFILAGLACCCLLGSVEKTARETAGVSSEPVEETLRSVWGPMDKCYPVTTQRRRIRTGKIRAAQGMTPGAAGDPNGASLKEETATLSRAEAEGRSPGQEAEGPPSAAKETVAGSPGWKGSRKIQKEIAVYFPGTLEEEHREERARNVAHQLLSKLWSGWLPDSDILRTQDNE